MRSVDPSVAYRLLYPSVPVIVAAARGDKISAMPVVSIISISNNPALMGFAISPSHDTYQAIKEARRFSCSWLGEEYRSQLEKMGTTSGASVKDKLAACGLGHRMEGSPAVPVVAESSAFMLCEVEDEESYGDHVFIVARVEQAVASDDFKDYWSFRKYRPIVYSGMSQPRLKLS